jgi:4-amino-4-deoxy-L-arabinose transferase-like glycosyltransferase
VSGGPPGPLLIFAILARIGLGGPVAASLLVVLVGTAAAPAAAITVRRLADEDTARRAAPFLAFAPIAIWVATSADALFLGISAWAIALLAIAATSTGASRFRGDLTALAGGLLLGAGLYCSYGIAPLGAVVVAVVLSQRRVRPLLLGSIGVAAVALAFAAYGFWWWTGLTATRIRYAESIANVRPYGYFLIADLAAFAIAVGPATIAGIASLPRNSRLWWTVGGALLAATSSDLSGLSKGEVERIWLPFAIWLLPAAAALGSRRARRGWLAAQIILGLTLQLVLVTDW